jgi:hypothetical protein
MNQMNYVKNMDLGYDKEQTVVVQINNEDIYTTVILLRMIYRTGQYCFSSINVW